MNEQYLEYLEKQVSAEYQRILDQDPAYARWADRMEEESRKEQDEEVKRIIDECF